METNEQISNKNNIIISDPSNQINNVITSNTSSNQISDFKKINDKKGLTIDPKSSAAPK